MSMAMWLPSKRADPLQREKPAGFLLPGLALGVGLFILIDGAISSISRVALWLAVATLLTVGIRLLLSARSLRIITEERYRQAHTDELTGLGNRRQLSLILDLFFADEVDTDAAPREMAFLFVDLNHFKEINDSFGHPAGDELLAPTRTAPDARRG